MSVTTTSRQPHEGTRAQINGNEEVPQAPMATDADEVQPEPAKAKPAKKAGSKKVTKKAAPFTKAQVIKALKDWAKAHDGKAPSSAEFWPARQLQYAKAAKTVADRKRFEKVAKDHVAAGLPITPQVVRVFGSWNAAIEAAGLTPKRTSEGRQATT